jgi:hypothetical protein
MSRESIEEKKVVNLRMGPNDRVVIEVIKFIMPCPRIYQLNLLVVANLVSTFRDSNFGTLFAKSGQTYSSKRESSTVKSSPATGSSPGGVIPAKKNFPSFLQ